MWKLNNIFLNNQEVKKKPKGIRKYLKMKESKNTNMC